MKNIIQNVKSKNLKIKSTFVSIETVEIKICSEINHRLHLLCWEYKLKLRFAALKIILFLRKSITFDISRALFTLY